MLTLNRALDHAFNGVNTTRVWVPALDVAERGDAYLVHRELPGFERSVRLPSSWTPSGSARASRTGC